MSFNGSGTFTCNSAGQPVVYNTIATDTAFNALTADLATGLSTCITKNGQTTVTADIPFGGYKATGIAAATTTGDALSYGRAATVTTLAATGAVTGIAGFADTQFGFTCNFTFRGISNNDYIDVVATSNGVRLASGATSWAAISDERKKTPFAPFVNALNKVAEIKTGTGRYLTDDEAADRSFMSAQSVQAVLPQAVDEDADGFLMLRTTDVIPLLVAALKEAKARIEALEAR